MNLPHSLRPWLLAAFVLSIAPLRTAVAQIYVANDAGNTVTNYSLTAAGNATPTAVISGPSLNSPHGVAVDANFIYVANIGNNSVTIYPLSANGNATPTATIIGGPTRLNGPAGIAVNASNIFVTNSYNNSVTEYPLSESGIVATPPTATIIGSPTLLAEPAGIAVDRGHIYVANVGPPGLVTIFALSATGNAAPGATISGTSLSNPIGIAVTHSQIYVANSTNASVAIYPLNANGTGPPTATISGSSLVFPFGIAVRQLVNDSHIYVANFGNNSVTVYPWHNYGSGPTATITSSNQVLNQPWGIAVGAPATTHLYVGLLGLHAGPYFAQTGAAYNLTVTALDAFNNTATGYSGTVQFSSNDSAAVLLPLQTTLPNGTGTVSVTFNTRGLHTVTATDTMNPSITGTSTSFLVVK